MIFKQRFFLLAILFWSSLSFANTPKVVLNLKLSKPAVVNIKGEKFKLSGNYQDNSINIGKSSGVNLPANSLFGEKGSLAFDFKYKIMPGYNLKLRQFFTIRGKGRLYIGAYLRPNNYCHFAFRPTVDKNSLKTLKPLKPGKWYHLLITWDKAKFKFYLNGKLQGEEKQSSKAEFPSYSKLHFGPFEDKWTTCKPWGEDDCFIKNLKIWDKDLSIQQVLADSGIKAKNIIDQYPAFLNIPKINIPPIVDGEIAEKEWEKASSFITLNDARKPLNSLSYKDNRPMLCHDGKNLYISFQTRFPKGTKILAGNKRVDKDIEVWGSESFEIYFYIRKKLYRFGGNVAGGYCESLDGKKSFYAKWKYCSNLNFQIDDSCLWQAEIVIPFASIGIKNTDKEPHIKFNFCRTWQSLPSMGLTMFGNYGSYNNILNFASIKLGHSSIAAQTKQISNPCFGQFKNTQSFYSDSKCNLHYQIKLLDNTGTVPEYSLVNDKFILEKQRVLTKIYKDKINSSSFNRILFKLKDDKGNLILQQLVPFQLSKNYINVTPVFSESRIMVNVNYSILKENYPESSFMICLLSPENEQLVTQKVNSNKNFYLKFNRSNKKGKYAIQLINSKGKILDQKNIPYIGKAKWENYDETSKVIPPFTPLKVKKSQTKLDVSVWNRFYTFLNSLQPSQIVSGKDKLLYAPVNLEINDERISLNKFEFTKNTPAEIAYETSGDNKAYSYKQASFIEYDGVIFNKLTIKAKEDLTNIRLIIPINSKFSKFLHATCAGFGGGGKKNLIIDKDINLNFYPSIWLGNEEKGLAFFAESNSAWLGKKNSAIQIKHRPETNILQITFADKLASGKKINLEFGLLATPIKPLPERYPLNIFNSMSYSIHLNQTPPQKPVTYIDNTSTKGWGFFDLPLDNKDNKTLKWLKGHIEKSKKSNSIFAPYFANMFLHEDYPAVISNILEWQRTPASNLLYERNGKMYRYFWCCAKSNARKFFLYKFSELLKKQPFQAVYFDFGPAYYCNNHLHGCKGNYPLMAQRKFYQGIASAFVQAGIKDYAIIVHNSDSVQLPTFTHVTHFFNGEGLRQLSSSTFHFGKDIQETYTLSDFASEHSSLPFGITSSVYVPTDPLLKRFGGGKEDQELYRFRMTKATLAGTLIHNTISSPVRMHYGLYDKLVRFYDEFGVSEAQFIPYWHNNKYVKIIKGKNIYVSVYKSNKKKEILAVISHVGKEHLKQDVEIEFYPKEFGLKSFTSAKELFTSPDPDYKRLYKEKNIRRNPIKLGDFGIRFGGLKNNIIQLNLDFHSVALVKLKGR